MRALLFTLKTLPFFGLCLLLNILPATAQTQSQTLLLVSQHVGEVIDPEEKVRFNLFPFIADADFQLGRFFQLADKQIVLEIIKKNGQAETRNYTQTEFDLTGQLIDAKAANLQPPKPAAQPAPQYSPPPQYGSYTKTQPVNQVLTGRVYYVILNDGMKFFANIAERQPGYYVFATQYFGTITAGFGEIKYLKEVENKLRNDAYWIPNAHDSRLFFGPTGRGIPRGEGYFQTVYGFLHSANYGLSDNFSLGTTFLLFPGVPLDYSVYSLTPKLSLPVSKKTSLAAGFLYANFFGDQVGIVYGAGTIGSHNDHITGGLGFGFYEDQLHNAPVIMLGGVKRVSNLVSLMAENYIVSVPADESNFQPSKTMAGGLYGLRFIWPRTNLDLAAFYFYDSSEFIQPLTSSYILPAYVSFTFKLGNRKQVGRAN